MTHRIQDTSEVDAALVLRYATTYHAPVMWQMVVKHLVTNQSGIYIDATAGGGGMIAALLDVLSIDARLFGIDQDEEALREIRKRLPDEIGGRLSLIHGNFADVIALLESHGIDQVDGIICDLGLSSHQINQADRGFAFDSDGELDMRMDQRLDIDASDLINSLSMDELRRIFRTYGDEPRASRIAKAVVEHRPLSTTRELADVIRRIVPYGDVARTLARVFQSVRVAVNDEMVSLERLLEAAATLIKPGGRLAVMSYQGNEDVRVKRMMRHGNFDGIPIRDVYGNTATPWNELTRKPITPSEVEKRLNPRSRSARLRIAERRKDQPDSFIAA